MKHAPFLLINLIRLILLFAAGGSILFSCSNSENHSLNESGMLESTSKIEEKEAHVEKIEKAIIYLENSQSMFGYISDYTNYVDVVSELANKSEFVAEKTLRDFYFINGANNIITTKIGNDPVALKNKLNEVGFTCGDITKSNLNEMFHLALDKAKKDTVSILVTDAIYDLERDDQLKQLKLEVDQTKSKFIDELEKGNVQTLVIKLSSKFRGYYFPVADGGKTLIDQIRPFYVFIFGESELLNKYFKNEYIEGLSGLQNTARFLKLSDSQVPYHPSGSTILGSFKIDYHDITKLKEVKSDRNGEGFSFSFAVDFSKLPFSDSYYTDTTNYQCLNSSFEVREIKNVADKKLHEIPFKPTHLITVGTRKNPTGSLEIILNNSLPPWINETGETNDKVIKGDTSKTYGFEFLMNGINEAYQFENNNSVVTRFSFQLTN